MSGGNFIESAGVSVAGIWGSASGSLSASAPSGRESSYAFSSGSAGPFYRTPNLGGSYASLYAGFAFYPGSLPSGNAIVVAFLDASANSQCDLRVNPTGLFFFTRNGTVIGSTSTYALIPAAWSYVEFKAIFSTTGTGTCEVRINGVVILTATSVTNATTTATAAVTQFNIGGTGFTGTSYCTDFYVVDGGSGSNTSYLGDVQVVEVYPNGAGVNSAWTANVGPFTLTSVNTTGVYQGTITGGASNAYVGYNFNVTGFTNGANNVTGAVCTASTATALTLTATTISETHAGSAAFQAITQAGINGTGTRPNGDVTYVSSNVTSQKIDYAHQAFTTPGSILGVVHQSYMRKDDAGTRIVAQLCISTGTTEQSSNISLGGSYVYYQDILENDPHTGSAWTASGFNAATFGSIIVA